MSEDCLFCKMLKGEVPSTEVYSDDEFYAFQDIRPAAPVHIRIRAHRAARLVLGTSLAFCPLGWNGAPHCGTGVFGKV